MFFSERCYAETLHRGRHGLIFGMIGNDAFGLTGKVGIIPNIRPRATCRSKRLKENDMSGSAFINFNLDFETDCTSLPDGFT